jgi:hypothetical protein
MRWWWSSTSFQPAFRLREDSHPKNRTLPTIPRAVSKNPAVRVLGQYLTCTRCRPGGRSTISCLFCSPGVPTSPSAGEGFRAQEHDRKGERVHAPFVDREGDQGPQGHCQAAIALRVPPQKEHERSIEERHPGQTPAGQVVPVDSGEGPDRGRQEGRGATQAQLAPRKDPHAHEPHCRVRDVPDLDRASSRHEKHDPQKRRGDGRLWIVPQRDAPALVWIPQGQLVIVDNAGARCFDHLSR